MKTKSQNSIKKKEINCTVCGEMFVDAGGISPICNDQCGVITEMYYVMY